ncbi:MAG TPA: ROK family protein [Solirubrobacterales bacterium]|nr:ROK family protein [Solirubrobacterales bacterium]HMW44486.1 ROK family protein [Solirubrobacterales bacterium]HMY26022.1 ROK family protein [Solirubrobacterales bacterium]HNA24798.1 ROK family protein [Solirubrobacterales bacterium]HNH86591.1 ROK family protein [Solirubrobacterales bacterium]
MAEVESIGADLGGTKLAVGVVDGRPEALWQEEVPSKGYSQERVVNLLAQQINKAHQARPTASSVGVGIPATLDHETGHAISTVNLDLEDLPIREMLSRETRLPVAIDNDGNLAMLAEALYGAARGTSNALLLTIGTGIGGGIWLNGEIYRGSTGAGAELGHLVVEIDGHPCQGNCPNRGCVEAMASGTAIGRHGREAAEREPDSLLGRRLAAGEEIDAKAVNEAATAGDQAAIGAIDLAGHYLGQALVGLSNVFQPEVIVLGGGAIAFGELLIAPARREVEKFALKPMNETKVVAAELGPSAGMIGAAAYGRMEAEAA